MQFITIIDFDSINTISLILFISNITILNTINTSYYRGPNNKQLL